MADIRDEVKSTITTGKITGIDSEKVKIMTLKGYIFSVPLKEVLYINGMPLIYNKSLAERVLNKEVSIATKSLKNGSIETKVTIQPEQVKGTSTDIDTAR